MKKIKVIVKEKTLLELVEPAEQGDVIDLKEVVQVDTSYLDMLIDSEKGKAYDSRIAEVEKRLKAENENKILELNSQIESLKKEQTSALTIKEQEVEKKYTEKINELKSQKQSEINELKHRIDFLIEQNKSDIAIKERDVARQYSDKINELNQLIEILKNSKESDINQLKSQNDAAQAKLMQDENAKYSSLKGEYDILKAQFDSKISEAKTEVERTYEHKISEIDAQNRLALAGKDAEIKNKGYEYEIQKSQALQEQKDMYEQQLRDKDETISNLQRAKGALNVKQTGEDLEAWCDNEVTSCMQNGFFNCTWEKDNKVVKEEGETKGSKADYIFRIYASELHKEDEELASVCMDMKDENPDSVNKKTNADYYKQLDKNREKKKCKYALLVSNLEMDKPNALPIFKVSGYDDMYVVRPAYLMTFLNMITSLTAKFADIIMDQENEVGLKTKFALMQEFEDIKNTYLDKPLGLLEKAIEEISKNSNNIRTAVQNIDAQCDKINESYINQIQNKIDKYEIKFNGKILKKLPENE